MEHQDDQFTNMLRFSERRIDENKTLKTENADLRKENEELREKLSVEKTMHCIAGAATDLGDEAVAKLKSEIAALRSRLSAYEEGIRPEDAEDRGFYYINLGGDVGAAILRDGEWYGQRIEISHANKISPPDRLYKFSNPLPQKKEKS